MLICHAFLKDNSSLVASLSKSVVFSGIQDSIKQFKFPSMFVVPWLLLRCHHDCKSQRKKPATEFFWGICATWEATSEATVDTWWHWNNMYGLQNWALYYGKEQKLSSQNGGFSLWIVAHSVLLKFVFFFAQST